MMGHRSEGRYACTGTNKEQVAVNGSGQGELTLRTAKCEFIAFFHFIKKPGSSGAAFQPYDHQFKNIAPIGPGRNGITAPPLIGFFMNRQVKRNKLSGFKIE